MVPVIEELGAVLQVVKLSPPRLASWPFWGQVRVVYDPKTALLTTSKCGLRPHLLRGVH